MRHSGFLAEAGDGTGAGSDLNPPGTMSRSCTARGCCESRSCRDGAVFTAAAMDGASINPARVPGRRRFAGALRRGGGTVRRVLMTTWLFSQSTKHHREMVARFGRSTVVRSQLTLANT